MEPRPRATAAPPRIALPLPLRPAPRKRPRSPPPAPFDDPYAEPDADLLRTSAKPTPTQSKPAAPKLHDPPPDLQISDLHRRHLRRRMARRSATPKRRRPPPPVPLPPVSTPALPPPAELPLLKPHSDPPRINGRAPTRKPPPMPQSLWERIADAQDRLEGQARVDPRFVSNRRPLDCVDNLRASIAITLFPDGYARHDWTSSLPDLAVGGESDAGENAMSGRVVPPPNKNAPNVKNTNIATLPRFPYDRTSRDFLRALDLGLIPPPEDLPDPSNRYYYDGCLIADVHDLRNMPNAVPGKGKAETRSRIILRPDMSAVYCDIHCLTKNVDPAVAIMAEQKILNAIARPVNCDPRPPQLTSSVQHVAVHTNTHAFNIARQKKRRRITRAPEPLSLSKAALLLVRAADKHHDLQRNAILSHRVLSSDNILLSKHGVQPAASSTLSGGSTIAVSAGISGDSSTGHEPPKASINVDGAVPPGLQAGSKRRISRPPKMLLDLHLGKGQGARSSGQNLTPSVPSAPYPPRSQQERLRTVRLILLDQKDKVLLQQAQVQAMSNGPSADSAERVKSAQQQALMIMNKAGKQVYILDMLRRSGRGCEIVLFRGLYGDKARDMFRIQPASVEEGHWFLEQFKAITKKEGYCCLQDMTPSSHALQQQQQQQARAVIQQRQAANASVRQQAAPQTYAAPQSQPSQPKLSHARQTPPTHQQLSHQQMLQVQQKQKQLQIQRQQQLQRQRQQQGLAQTQAQQHLQQPTQLHQQAQLQQATQHSPHVPIPQAQHQLPQAQHQLTLQQQQVLRQQMQHQQLQHLHQQQNIERAHRQLQQMQRHDKGNVNIQQSAAALAANGRGGQVVSKAGAGGRVNVAMARAAVGTAGHNTSAMANMGSGAMMGHNQVFAPAHLQHMQQLRNQQIRAQEHQRNMMAAVAGAHAPTAFPRNGNIAAANTLAAQQQLQNQALTAAAIVGSAAMATGNARPGTATNLNGADGLTHQHRLQQHFKQQRENIEAQARAGKR